MGLIIHRELCDGCGVCIEACPFQAIERGDSGVQINAGCKLCRLCVKACPREAIEWQEAGGHADTGACRGILVFAEMHQGRIHPVTFELIGKAAELSEVRGEPVYCVCIGDCTAEECDELRYYGLRRLLLYSSPAFAYFRADSYTSALADAIRRTQPGAVLVGATPLGRSLAPRTAVRFETGLTADCTALEMREDGNLVQIRPAFGGNIMAQILTKKTRPQFATVRYKVMNEMPRQASASCEIERVILPEEVLSSPLQGISWEPVAQREHITDAEVLVVAGAGIRAREDLAMLERLAQQLGGQLAGTRPLVERGWLHYTRQIGLSGRTVKPKLIITCGVSGAVQFTAGMRDSGLIIAINQDPEASIFSVAHHGYVCDLYEMIPRLLSSLENAATTAAGRG